MTYYQEVSGVDVYVTVDRPHVLDKDGQYAPANFFIAAFKFWYPPSVIIGEYLKDDTGRASQFQSENEAASAAFLVATARIRETKSPV
jgi:hypothetical protein